MGKLETLAIICAEFVMAVAGDGALKTPIPVDKRPH
jgi:hypothetical protein